MTEQEIAKADIQKAELQELYDDIHMLLLEYIEDEKETTVVTGMIFMMMIAAGLRKFL